MKAYVEVGSAPCNEECAQVGDEDYAILARAECQRYIRQLERMFPNKPEGARLVVRGNNHDFGTYYEVAVSFDDRDEKAMDYAYRVEDGLPAQWDEAAKAE